MLVARWSIRACYATGKHAAPVAVEWFGAIARKWTPRPDSNNRRRRKRLIGLPPMAGTSLAAAALRQVRAGALAS